MKKRIVSSMLIIMLFASVLTGCKGKETSKKKEPYVPVEQDVSKITVGKYNWPAHQGIDYTKPYNKRFDGLTFTMGVNGNGSDLPEGMTVEENTMTWAFEGITGLKMKALWTASGSAYSQKLSQAITSCEIPDLMFVSLNQYRKLAQSGLIADLTEELLEGEHPTIQEIYAQRDNQSLEALKIDGRIYGIPHVAASFDGASLVWIRKDWREKLNLDEPQSIEDLEKIALAFMEQDPDGNGKKDTYGIPATSQYGAFYGGYGFLGDLFLNVGGAAPCTWQEQEDGTLIYGSLMDGAKDALTLLNSWYKKGILPSDFATWDANALNDAIGNDQAGIVFAPWYAGTLGLYNNIALNEIAEWEAFMLPGKAGDPVYAVEGDFVAGIYVVSKDFEYPEAFVYAYDMIESFGNQYNADAPNINFLYKDCEGYEAISNSYNPMYSPVRSDYYTRPIKTVYEMTENAGELAAMTEVDTIKACLEGKIQDVGLKNRISTAIYPTFPVLTAINKHENPRKVVVDECGDANATYQNYLLYWEGPEAIYKANPIGVSTKYMGLTDSMGMYSTFLESFEQEAYTKMIMGHTDGKSISKYFDTFVKEYLKQGGEVVAKDVNAEYAKK